jgi:hypothetical protein
MSLVHVIGVDPGRTTGIAALSFADGRLVDHGLLQCTPDLVQGIVDYLLDRVVLDGRRILAVERFVVRARAGRSADAAAGEITRDLIGALGMFQEIYSVEVFLRTAAEVKPWATDKRLAAAGVTGLTGMRHAADAARHALFAAVKDGGITDPLSGVSHG